MLIVIEINDNNYSQYKFISLDLNRFYLSSIVFNNIYQTTLKLLWKISQVFAILPLDRT